MNPKTAKIIQNIENQYLIARALGQKAKALRLWKLKTALEVAKIRLN